MTAWRQCSLVGFVLVSFSLGCNQGADRFEDIGKLRGIGILSSPVVAVPSTPAAPSIVTLTFYAAIPAGGTITSARAFNDVEGATATIPADLVVAPSGSYDDHATVRVYTIQAKLMVPPAQALLFDPSSGFAVVHFGIELESDHGNQDIVGNTVVYPAGSSQLNVYTKTPTIAIIAPADKAVIGNSEQPLAADLTAVNNETFRIGWFVTGGNVDNRNSAATKWDPKGTGPFTLIATTRGVESAAFGISVIDVTAQ